MTSVPERPDDEPRARPGHIVGRTWGGGPRDDGQWHWYDEHGAELDKGDPRIGRALLPIYELLIGYGLAKHRGTPDGFTHDEAEQWDRVWNSEAAGDQEIRSSLVRRALNRLGAATAGDAEAES